MQVGREFNADMTYDYLLEFGVKGMHRRGVASRIGWAVETPGEMRSTKKMAD
jgi:hypothetical protein